jgi:hypothetical protein
VSPDPIGAYLDQLMAQLRGSAADVRRILAEAEEHLRDASAERVAAGAGEAEAQRAAIAAFGDARTVARRFAAGVAPVPAAEVVAQLLRTALVLGAVGLVAIGASGLVAELIGRVFGPAAVAGDPPGVTYTAARCADFLEYFPHAGSCAKAAALHHWGEVVEYRVAVGVLGLLALGGAWLWRRGERTRDGQATWVGVLPAGFAATIATSLYGVAALALGLEGLGDLRLGPGAGAGQWLSAALVSAVMCAAYGVPLAGHLLGRRAARA